MTFFVYAKPCGYAHVATTRQDDNPFFIGYTFLYETDVLEDLNGKQWDGSQWVMVQGKPQYMRERAEHYPSVGDQLDALWHAMDSGQTPKIEPFYSDILAVKVQFPKPSN